MSRSFHIINANATEGLRTLPAESVHCCVTSPPYWGLRDYGVAGQIGQERTPEEYAGRIVEVFSEVRRVLRSDGTLWINLGDCYTSGNRTSYHSGATQNKGQDIQDDLRRQPTPQRLKPKDLVGIPWRVAFALQADGWYLRSDIIWHKPNPMPESVADRPTKAHEYLFLLSKSERYAYDAAAIAERSIHAGEIVSLGEKSLSRGQATGANCAANGNGTADSMTVTNTRNKRSVWSITTKPYTDAHFAVMPTALVEPCVLAGCPNGGVVLDPFSGSGTVGVVALRHDRSFIGCELNPGYADMARDRIMGDAPMFNLHEISAAWLAESCA